MPVEFLRPGPEDSPPACQVGIFMFLSPVKKLATGWHPEPFIAGFRGVGKGSATLAISDEDLKEIGTHTADGDKYPATFTVRIEDELGGLMSLVKKVLYIRRKTD